MHTVSSTVAPAALKCFNGVIPLISKILLIGISLLFFCGRSWAASPAPVSETEPNNTAPTANSISILSGYAMVSASINPGGDTDYYLITGVPAGARIWVETDTGGPQNPGATSRDTVMDVLAADGVTVIENDDDDGVGNGADGTVETGLASIVAGRTLTAGGTYYIRVRSFSGTAVINPYILSIATTNAVGSAEIEPNATAATSNDMLTLGNSTGLQTGAINAPGDIDYYSLALKAGDTVFFCADSDPERDGIGTDLVLEFRNPSDALLLTVDSSTTGSLLNPAAEGSRYTVPSDGIYYVKVRHIAGVGTGSYHLMAAVREPAPAGSATSVPTLSAWGVILFSGLLILTAIRTLRHQEK